MYSNLVIDQTTRLTMISDNEIILKYYGQPPYYRNTRSGNVEKLPFRVRLPDGTTRTDPIQWANNPQILSIAGYEITTIQESDIAKFRPTIDQIKSQKLNELEIYWNNKIQEGWTSPEGWKLGLSTDDVTLLTGAFLLLKESSSLGLASTTSIIDTSNIPHTLDLQQMTTLMLSYGSYRSSLSGQYSSYKNQINDSTTIEQLESIIIGE